MTRRIRFYQNSGKTYFVFFITKLAEANHKKAVSHTNFLFRNVSRRQHKTTLAKAAQPPQEEYGLFLP